MLSVINIYVGNLTYDATEADLIEHFSKYAPVVKASIVFDRETGRSRGFGFVELDDRDAGLKAIGEMAGKEFLGRPLTINEARPRGSGQKNATGNASSATAASADDVAAKASTGTAHRAATRGVETEDDVRPPSDRPRNAAPIEDDADNTPEEEPVASRGYSNQLLGAGS